MGKVRVAVYGTVGKTIFIDTGLAARVTALEASLNTGGVTAHNQLSGLQIGNDHPQYALRQSAAAISGVWNFTTLPYINGTILDEFIEDKIGSELRNSDSIYLVYSDYGGTEGKISAHLNNDYVEDFVAALLCDSPTIVFDHYNTAGCIKAHVDESFPFDWTGAHVFDNARGITVTDDVNAGYAAFREASDSLFERSVKIVRFGSPNIAGVYWGAALTGAPAAAAIGAVILELRGWAYGGSTFTGPLGFQIVTTENWTESARGAKLVFNTIKKGTTVNRNAAVFDADTGYSFGNTTDNPTYSFLGTGTTTFGGVLRLKGYTVATLPAGTIGDTAYVTDANAPVFGAAVAGGGAVMVPVYYTGAAWFVG